MASFDVAARRPRPTAALDDFSIAVPSLGCCGV
jgi:hypothetical protein